MTKEILQADLGKIRECDFVRCTLEQDEISIFLVGDNEKCGDEEEEDDDCCEGLNGHLFKIVFSEVRNYQFDGEEADFYSYEKVDVSEHSLCLVMNGTSLNGPGTHTKIRFAFGSYVVKDLGKIEGPDA